jgi:hypothetical protein
MRKLYAYVDENGTDTKGEIFIVGVVVITDQKDTLLAACEQLEQATGKGKNKWRKSKHSRRIEYLRRVFSDRQFKGSLRYALFRGKIDQHEATIEAIVRAIKFDEPTEKYTTRIYVDALSKTLRHKYSAAIRERGVPTEKLQGVAKDENDALIRLADHIAGLIRDAYGDRNEELLKLCEQGKRNGILVEV